MWTKIIVWLVISLVAWYLAREMLISLDNYIRKTNFAKKITAEKKRFKFSTDPVFKR